MLNNKKFNSVYPRGSEWRQWDLHIHTPASFEWGGKRFAQMSESEKITEIDKIINALNKAKPAVFALMDYWTFNGWFALQKRLKDPSAPKLEKLVLPGIELRLVSPTSYRLNAHVIFSNEIKDQDLIDFKSKLKLQLQNKPLSDEALRQLANSAEKDILNKHGTTKDKVSSDEDHALIIGSKIAEIKADTYCEAIQQVPNNQAIGFMPWDTYNGLSEADWVTHYSYVKDLMCSSTIFETRKESTWGLFVGQELEGNKKIFAAFQDALNHEPKLAVSGSDAHKIIDYGVFPNSKPTWIKADPTYLGLLQAIKEPAKRSFIGDMPNKLKTVEGNKSFFIDSVEIKKLAHSTLSDIWLDGNKIHLNCDLVAIIGNKGSGKSALADVIALLGNTKNATKFSFLDKKRFRNPKQKLAENFEGSLNWLSNTGNLSKTLNEDTDSSKVEMVRYIPQSYFEELCNENTNGGANQFQDELESVIFSHISDSIRGDAFNFQQLVKRQEAVIEDGIAEHSKSMSALNLKIAAIEEELSPSHRLETLELIVLKESQIKEHLNSKPITPQPPTETLDANQKIAAEAIEKINRRSKEINYELDINKLEQNNLSTKFNAVSALQGRMNILNEHIKQFEINAADSLNLVGLKIEDIFSYKLDTKKLLVLKSEIETRQAEINIKIEHLTSEKTSSLEQKNILQKQLNAPQQKYQEDLTALNDWDNKQSQLTGTSDTPDSLEGLKARLIQINSLQKLLNDYKSERTLVMHKIFQALDSKRNLREKFFEPLQNLLNNNSLIKNEYQLTFQAKLSYSIDKFADQVFESFKQTHGEFKGQRESFELVERLLQSHDLNSQDGVTKFLDDFTQKLINSAQEMPSKIGPGIAAGMKANKSEADLYDYLYGLNFLTPRYTLMFQNTPIEFLSPGQRGALLLIFYLLVDSGHTPIVLDQPEENLDNQTIVSLLVPVLTEAKKRRQIIMVTHNPNLAVVCDAEQVIYASFDKSNANSIKYTSGSIEHPELNLHTVNVLEGTKVAFDNRRAKYHDSL